VETTAATVRPAPNRCEAVRPTSGFDVLVLGSGGGPSNGRASSGFVVFIDGRPRILVDAGKGTFPRMQQSKIDPNSIDTILVTHFHGDHVADLDDFLMARAKASPVWVRLFGPTGEANGQVPSPRVFVERVYGREGGTATRVDAPNAIRLDVREVEHSDKPTQLIADHDLVVSAISVDHGDAPTLAYRIQKGRHSVVFSGDLAGRNDNLPRLAHGADLLVQATPVMDPERTKPREGNLARSGVPPERKQDNLYLLHAPPQRIGAIAAQAPVGELLLTHLPTAVRMSQDEVLSSIRKSFGGDVVIAEDCMLLPVGP
jgi:ribonuclease BN (tRNA processing enzyme)